MAASSETIQWRAQTFHVKEPTTLQWIQSLEKNSVLIDVGANIGIYTLPSALYHVKKVISLEPEIRNYNELVKNIEINNIDDKVDALPLAISTEFANSFTHIYLTKDEPGMSCHQVGRNQDFKLQSVPTIRKKRSVYCLPLSSVVFNTHKDYPSSPIHIKIDVDGIEEDVCHSLFESGALNYINSIQVELNPSIVQHNNLIKRLHLHGFSYSKAQVSTASRKTGAFKNFAEYVFRRYAAKEFLDNLPDSISTKFISTETVANKSDISGCIIGDKDKIKSDNLFCDKSFETKVISTTMPALSVPGFMSALDCLSAFISISQCVSKPFAFTSGLGHKNKPESTRLSVSMKKLAKIDQNYVKYLISFISDVSFLRLVLESSLPLFKNYLHIDESKPLPCGKKVTVRVRHFLDIQGFYLTKHHDSPDTLAALICPLSPSATTTSLFTRVPETRESIESDSEKKSFNLQSQFDPKEFYDPSPISNHVFGTQKLGTGINSHFYIQNTNLQHGDALIIPNLNCHLNSEQIPTFEQAIHNFGHGIFPPIPDLIRPVLLIDYLLTDINDIDKYAVPLISGNDSLLINLCSTEELLIGN